MIHTLTMSHSKLSFSLFIIYKAFSRRFYPKQLTTVFTPMEESNHVGRRVRRLAQGHLDTQLRGSRDRTSNLSVRNQPALELSYCWAYTVFVSSVVISSETVLHQRKTVLFVSVYGPFLVLCRGPHVCSFLFNGGSEPSYKDVTETFHRRWIAAKAIIGNGRATLITPFLAKLL